MAQLLCALHALCGRIYMITMIGNEAFNHYRQGVGFNMREIYRG